ncbi:coniferyl-aldehyde dehydrogenase [Corticibacter populi]|nr:coniferyl-aldehyde dehydrogenase [Corticibacter populi]
MELAALRAAFDLQYQASRAQPQVPEALRRERLLRLGQLLDQHGTALEEAIAQDYGVRSARLTQLTDIFTTRALLARALRQLHGWCKPQKVRTPLYLQPGRAWVMPQPLGVVGVMAPWNYPLQLLLAPAIGALAAGNRVLLKPSEHAPRLAQLLAELVPVFFKPEEMALVHGSTAMAVAFASLPFDHLVFTGSTETGRKIALAAAHNLTPTTLELGGKSPCVIELDADIAEAAIRIAHGKLLNAGQTCVAPDYLLLPRGMEQAFETAYRDAALTLYPGLPEHPDYASVISPTQWARLCSMLKQAEQMGARIKEIAAPESPSIWGLSPHGARQMPAVLAYGVTPEMRLMQEEIFGPVLPIVSYDRASDVPQIIRSLPRPLALYWFGRSEQARDALLEQTVSGGVTINETLLHVAHPNLPFGGVGASGWGAYHGRWGFERFSHHRAVYQPGRWFMGQWLRPPFGERFDRLMQSLRKWL